LFSFLFLLPLIPNTLPYHAKLESNSFANGK
jgi:hypothetical protein